jgi:hypothetical protein
MLLLACLSKPNRAESREHRAAVALVMQLERVTFIA